MTFSFLKIVQLMVFYCKITSGVPVDLNIVRELNINQQKTRFYHFYHLVLLKLQWFLGALFDSVQHLSQEFTT